MHSVSIHIMRLLRCIAFGTEYTVLGRSLLLVVKCIQFITTLLNPRFDGIVLLWRILFSLWGRTAFYNYDEIYIFTHCAVVHTLCYRYMDMTPFESRNLCVSLVEKAITSSSKQSRATRHWGFAFMDDTRVNCVL